MMRLAWYSGIRSASSVGLLVLAGGIFATPEAQASDGDPLGAEELFRQGVTAKQRGDWTTACDKFRKSMDLDANVSAQYKVAYCDERAGKLATAWLGYVTALKLNRETKSDKRRTELDKSINDAIAALEPRVPKLRIAVSPNDPGLKLEITRDQVTLDASSVVGEALPVDPGEHRIAVRAPGFLEQEVTVTVAEGNTVEAAIHLVPAPIPANTAVTVSKAPNAVSAPQQPPKNNTQSFATVDSRSSFSGSDSRRGALWGQRQTALVVGSAGVVTLGAAGYFGLRTLSEVGQMSQYKNPDGKTYNTGVYGPHDRAVQSQLIGFVLVGAGAVLTGLGIVLYATAPNTVTTSERAPVRRWVAAVTPTSAFVQGEW